MKEKKIDIQPNWMLLPEGLALVWPVSQKYYRSVQLGASAYNVSTQEILNDYGWVPNLEINEEDVQVSIQCIEKTPDLEFVCQCLSSALGSYEFNPDENEKAFDKAFRRVRSQFRKHSKKAETLFVQAVEKAKSFQFNEARTLVQKALQLTDPYEHVRYPRKKRTSP